MKDSPAAKRARNTRLNKERLSESERCQLEIDRGRSIPKRILRTALESYLSNGYKQPKVKPVPTVVDLTPISQQTIDYWAAQGYLLEDVQEDLQYQREIFEANKELIERGQRPYDPDKFGPLDPSHPYAYTPRYVTYKMRKEQNFLCFITGWHEKDWVMNKVSGEIREVGKLTRDHTKAAAAGGLTSAANLKMVCAMANRKKGHKGISYPALADLISQYWHVVAPVEGPIQEMTLSQLRKMGVKHVTL